jgi:hypothetical protein
MDPSLAHAAAEVLVPFLSVLACGAIPVTRRQDLMQPPDAPQLAQEASRTSPLSQIK